MHSNYVYHPPDNESISTAAAFILRPNALICDDGLALTEVKHATSWKEGVTRSTVSSKFYLYVKMANVPPLRLIRLVVCACM